MPRVRQLLALPILLFPAAFGSSAGGWAVVTVEHLPEYAVAGRSVTLSFTVRQHGQEPLKDLRPVVEARSGRLEARAAAVAATEPGQYVVSLVLPEPGEWGLTIHSGFGPSKLRLLPLKTIAASAPAPVPLADAVRGRHLFVAKGCVTCHLRGEDVDAEAMGNVGPPLTGKQFPAEFLGRFLADPSSAGPPRYANGPMPNLRLKQQEIAALTAYLNQR